MSNSIADVDPHPLPTVRRSRKAKSSSRELQQLSASLKDLQVLYNQSPLSTTIQRRLQTSVKTATTPITKILSLGLGSLLASKVQTRRLKQLTILLALRDTISQLSTSSIIVYAQDPTFTRLDKAFLTTLGIHILQTPSAAELGEAASIISPATLIYSPFLTIEIYEQLLVKSGLYIPIVFGDDFDALLSKWPKYSGERRQVDSVMKIGLARYRRRAISGEGFWAGEDGTFPMAVYEEVRLREGRMRARI